MKEGEFLTQPKLSHVDIGLLGSDFMGFLAIMPSTEGDEDWKTAFGILKYCNGGADVIPMAYWDTMLMTLKDLKQSRVLEIITRIATGNPILDVKGNHPHESLSAAWLERKTFDVREEIAAIAGSQRDAQIRALENAVFGDLTIIRLNYYTPERARILLDKDLNSFTQVLGLNHLLTFIQEFRRTDIQELCEILLVRGQWTKHQASRQMSDAFHNVLDVAEKITKLDDTLADDGSEGQRLKGAMIRVDRDKSQIRYINSIVEGVNEEAEIMIKDTMPDLILVGKHFKMLLDDCEKKPFELIMNWKDLGKDSKVPMSQRLAAAYKKINYFVQLMTLDTQPIEV
jgi:hypothetical protein